MDAEEVGRSREAPVVERMRASFRSAADRLQASGARDEALAVYVPARRTFRLFTKEATMEPLGRVWRLGVLLLDRDGGVFAMGQTTRAIDPGRRAYQSVSAEVRREYRAAAFRGPFARGETVNYDARPLELDASALTGGSGPLFLRDGEAFVRWSASADDSAAVALETYLEDRVGLLVHPPEGA